MSDSSCPIVNDDARPVPQLDVLLLELRRRWQAGERILVEDLSPEIAVSASHGETVLDLIYQEVLLREQVGERPEVDEYLRRFPHLTAELRMQFYLDMAIKSLQPDLASTHVESRVSLEGSVAFQASEFIGAHHNERLPIVEGYEVLHWIGQGGMAVVFKARHLKLNRPVALKMLRDHYGATTNHVRRFLTEARAAARLQHPHIVQIYEVGRHEGRPFLAYEFLDGGTLGEHTNSQPLEPRLAARLVETLARTLHFAHQHGVIHRDLKPGNILLQRIAESGVQKPASPAVMHAADPQAAGDVFSGFQLKIADFGLAKVILESGDLSSHSDTKNGDILGTPAYMSPEQARGDIANLTTATDTYALGAILYELLTGRPPFVGVQPLEVLNQVIADEPVLPSQLVRGVPKDLQTICLKCLDKSPGLRYASAADLADELTRFLGNQPIFARRTSAVERSWRWCRRHPVKAVLAASIVALLMLVIAVSTVYSMRLGHQLALTSNAKSDEQTAKVAALHQLWESHLSRAEALRTSGKTGQRYDGLLAIDSARALDESIPFSPDQMDRMRNATIASLALPDLQFGAEWNEDWSQHGSSITADAQHTIYAYLSKELEIVIRRVGDGSELARIAGLQPDARPLLSPDGTKLAILNESCRVFRLSTAKPELIFETGSKGAWGFTPDGKQILGTNGDGNLSLCDLQNGQVNKSFGSIVARHGIAVSPDSRRAAIFVEDTVQVIELETGDIILEVDAPQGAESATNLAWHPNSDVLATGPHPGDGVVLWDVESGTKLTSYFNNSSHLGIWFGSTGELFLTYDSWSGQMQLWNVSSGAVELSKMDIALLEISPDATGGFRMLQNLHGTRVATAEISHPRVYHTLPLIHPSSPVVSSFDLAYSADGQLLAAAISGDVQVFDAETLLPLEHLEIGDCYIRFDSDASLLTLNELGLNRWRASASAGAQQNPDASETRSVTFGPPERIGDFPADGGFNVSLDGKYFAVPDGKGAVVGSVEGEVRLRPVGEHHDIRSLSISPDGRRLVTGGWTGGKAIVWDIDSGTLIHTIDEPTCCMVLFSPDGKWLVTNSGEVTIWNAETWQESTRLDVPGRSFSGVNVCFSPGSNLLAVSDSTARIHLFNPDDGREIAVLTNPEQDLVIRMAFNPIGNQLAVLSPEAGGLVHVWDLVAIREELSQRDLAWLSDKSPKPEIASDLKRIDEMHFIADERFRQREATEQIRRALAAVDNYDLDSARAAIARAIELQPHDAFACNNLAWLLATGPRPLRDASTAITLARRAMQDKSLTSAESSLYLNTLGVALYRAGQIEEAVETLNKSLGIQSPESQPFDLFFLSMCHARLGDQKAARDFFDKAEALVIQHGDQMPTTWRSELAQFAEESNSLLDTMPTKPESNESPDPDSAL